MRQNCTITKRRFTLLFGLSCFFLLGAKCFDEKDLSFSTKNTTTEHAKEWAQKFRFDVHMGSRDLEAFTISPHPFGSSRQKDLGVYLATRLKEVGIKVAVQEFSSQVPNREYSPQGMRPLTLEKNGANILAYVEGSPKAPCFILFGSHYDTKEIPGQRYVGANDSASSSILLLQMASFFVRNAHNLGEKLACNVGFVWLDGEEAVLNNWDDGIHNHPSRVQDNTYGSRFLADKLRPCPINSKRLLCFDVPIWKEAGTLKAFILLDMIGSPQVSLTRESNSSSELKNLLEEGIKEFDNVIPLTQREQNIKDDHIAFCEKGILCLDLIDFNHLEHWHQESDTPDTLSFESIEKIGKIAVFLGLSLNP